MSKTLTSKLYLKQKLYGLKMQEGSDLAEHVNVFNQLVADLGKVDVKIEDEDMAIVLLCHLVTTLTYGKEKVQVDDVVSALLSHEQRRKNNSREESSGSTFMVRRDQSGEDKKGNKKKKGSQCYKCKGWGHKKAECPELKTGGGTASVVIAKKLDDSDSDGDILTVSSEKSCEAWLLDSASSFHATPKEWFSSYIEKDIWWPCSLG